MTEPVAQPTLQQRLQAISREIGRAKRRGEDPSPLIEMHHNLQAQLREQQLAEPAEEAMPVGPWLQVIDEPKALLALQPQYDALLRRSSVRSPFLLLEWLLPWFDHFGRDYDLHAALVREGDRLHAAALLMVGQEQRLGKRPVVRFLGTGQGLRGNYFAFAVDPASQVGPQLLHEHLQGQLGQGRLLHFEHLSPFPDGHQTLALLASQPDQELLIRSETGCVYGSLPTAYSEFVRGVPDPQRRKKLRCGDDRACRHMGSMLYEDCMRPDEVERLLGVLGDFSTARRRREGVDSTWKDSANQACRIEIAKRMLQRKALRLEAVYSGAKPIGALVGFVFKDRYFCYNMGFDQDYAQYEPGHLLVARRIQGCIAEGMHEYDFLVGDASYKRQYFRNVVSEMQVSVLPPKGAARLAETAVLFARSLKRSV